MFFVVLSSLASDLQIVCVCGRQLLASPDAKVQDVLAEAAESLKVKRWARSVHTLGTQHYVIKVRGSRWTQSFLQATSGQGLEFPRCSHWPRWPPLLWGLWGTWRRTDWPKPGPIACNNSWSLCRTSGVRTSAIIRTWLFRSLSLIGLLGFRGPMLRTPDCWEGWSRPGPSVETFCAGMVFHWINNAVVPRQAMRSKKPVDGKGVGEGVFLSVLWDSSSLNIPEPNFKKPTPSTCQTVLFLSPQGKSCPKSTKNSSSCSKWKCVLSRFYPQKLT